MYNGFCGSDEDKLRGAIGSFTQAVEIIEKMLSMGHCPCSESYRKDAVNLSEGASVMLSWLKVE